MHYPSRFWPYIRSIAKTIKGLTGTPPLVGLGIDGLIDLQDQLAKGKGESLSEIKTVLNEILEHGKELHR